MSKGKWAPLWEGPFEVIKALDGNAYALRNGWQNGPYPRVSNPVGSGCQPYPLRVGLGTKRPPPVAASTVPLRVAFEAIASLPSPVTTLLSLSVKDVASLSVEAIASSFVPVHRSRRVASLHIACRRLASTPLRRRPAAAYYMFLKSSSMDTIATTCTIATTF
ncbi:hypothetical protein PIB30_039704 [Stylosanthes scabra]|uniref:Uncharacterized protein n=1 Tax=Stylosanthes scabra TaxID=79078 RepID=A0ABU6YD82_9FABA|nr:hypothetical protein [Stylosanthes scabra]